MDSFREQWGEASKKAKAWITSVSGQEPKDYSKLIAELERPSLKDQTLILKVRTTYLYSIIVGGLVSTTAAFWACGKSGGAWIRWRIPVSLGAGWIGAAAVGMKQAQIASRSFINAIEDPSLREVMKGWDQSRLTAEQDRLLRVNIFEHLDSKAIYKLESEKHDMTIRDRLEHLKNEQERTGSESPTAANEAVQGPTPTSPSVATPSGPTPYLRQRLPEAVEAERRRTNPGSNSSDPSTSNSTSSD